jgi:putative endonuclease
LRYLVKKGYALIERNYSTRHGEIDLVVRGERALVFVEGKLRRGTGYGDPLEAVTPKQQARIRLMAEQYLAERGDDFVVDFHEMRFDVVGILLSDAGRPEVRHVEDAF